MLSPQERENERNRIRQHAHGRTSPSVEEIQAQLDLFRVATIEALERGEEFDPITFADHYERAVTWDDSATHRYLTLDNFKVVLRTAVLYPEAFREQDGYAGQRRLFSRLMRGILGEIVTEPGVDILLDQYTSADHISEQGTATIDSDSFTIRLHQPATQLCLLQ